MGLRDSIANVTPAWLNGFVGSRYLYSMGVTLDAVWEKARQSVRARFPENRTPNALAPLGADRLIERGFDEDDASYAARLLGFRALVRYAGNAPTLLEILYGYLFPHVDNGGPVPLIKVVNQQSWWWTLTAIVGGFTIALENRGAPLNWDWDGDGATLWARAWVLLRVPNSLWVAEGDWGVGDGSTWGDGGTWGLTATPAQINGLLAAVRNWIPARSIVEVVVSLDDDLFVPTSPLPDPDLPNGTWDRWVNRDVRARYLGPVDHL